jgi:hypothetical protein
VSPTPLPNPFPAHCPDFGTFVQRLREARYAARSLPGTLAKMRAIMPPSLWEEILLAPIEEAEARLATGRVLNERTRAASELRQLRDIFAGTGFGDMFTAPADFAARADAIASRAQMAASVGPIHSPEALDILLDGTTPGASFARPTWPAAIVRAANARDLAEIAARGDHFDVLIFDDAGEFADDALDRLSAAGTRVHRIGAEIEGDTIVLELPHRQRDPALADLASGRPGRWLAAPIELGVVVREAGSNDLDALRAAGARLAEMLRLEGCNAVLAPEAGNNSVADVIVAVLDTLRDSDLRALAGVAREGIVVLCRRDLRSPAPAVDTTALADAVVARSLGWRIRRSCVDGVLVEKDGGCVALVEEPLMLTAVDEMVTDMVGRLTALGWRPLVAWRDAPRDPQALERLLTARAVPVPRDHRVRMIAEKLEIGQPKIPTIGIPTIGAATGNDITIAPALPIRFPEQRGTVVDSRNAPVERKR